MHDGYKYLAFISYKREDEEYAKSLQYSLEHYKLPTAVRKNNPSLPKKARPIFRDTTDLTGGVLEKAIKNGLDTSKYLIIVCSPRAAQSEWVCKEVQEFIDTGREEYIIPYIIEGEPNALEMERECFPKNLRELSGSRELLGININESGKDLAAIKIVAHILGLQLDTLWERWAREKKIRRRWIISLTMLVVFIALAVAGIMFFQRRNMQKNLARAVANRAEQLIDEGDSYLARKLLVEVLPDENDILPYPYTAEAEAAMRRAYESNSGVFKGHKDYVILATFSPNGKGVISLSSGDIDGDVYRIWDVYSGTCIKNITYKKDMVSYADDGWCLASIAKDDDVIKLWSGETGECINEFCVSGGNVSNIEFCADDEHLYTRHEYGTYRLWDVYKGICIKEFSEYHYISSIDVNARDEYVVFSYQRQREDEMYIDLYSLKTNEILRTFGPYNEGRITGVYFSFTGEYIVVEFYDGTIKLLSIENGECIRSFYNVIFNYHYNMLNSHGKHIVITNEDERCFVWDMYSGDCMVELDYYISSASVSRDGKYLLADNTMLLLETGETVKDFHVLDCTSVAFSHDGQCAVFASRDKKVHFYDLSIKKDECTIIHKDDMDYDVDHGWSWSSGDGRYSVYGSDDRVHLFDVVESETIPLYGHEGEVNSTTFSPNGEFIVSTANDGTIRIWSVKNMECMKTLDLNEFGSAQYASFSSDGRYIVSVSNVISIWHVDSRKCIKTIKYPQREEGYYYEEYERPIDIESISFCPDDSRIILVYNDGVVYQWNYQSLQELVEETKVRFKDNPLTPEEREEYHLY